MKKRSRAVAFATMVAMILIVSGAAAISQQGSSGMPPGSNPSPGKMPQHHQEMMDMSAMMQEPHHVLAMAYQANLVNFAKALSQKAAEAKTVNPEFARAAVAEMKRSFDQMLQHHQGHMKAMDGKMHAPMADMMKQMDAHHSAIQEHLAALDKEVQTSAPDSKGISTHIAEILKQCEGMSKMHAGTREPKMAGPKDPKMN